jgi:hypothetical protein
MDNVFPAENISQHLIYIGHEGRLGFGILIYFSE